MKTPLAVPLHSRKAGEFLGFRFIHIALLLLGLGWSAPTPGADEECRRSLAVLGAFPIEKYHPHFRLKGGGIPYGSRSFILWRSRTPIEIPDSAFRLHFMTEKDLVELGGWIIGEKIIAKSPRSPHGSLSEGQKDQLAAFYSGEPQLLRVTREVMKPFLPVLDTISKKFGSPEKMLSSLGIDPTLTPRKRDAIQAGRAKAGGKYLISAEGEVLYFSEADLAKLQEALGVSGVVHGHLAAFSYFHDPNVAFIDAIDHGSLQVTGHGPSLHSNQVQWNPAEKALNIETFLLPPPPYSPLLTKAPEPGYTLRMENHGAPFSPEEVQTCIKVLETMVADQLTLSRLTVEERKTLLIAAGRVSRPDKLERMKLAKAQRRIKKRQDIRHDNQLRNESLMRRQREEAVYVAPAQIAPPQAPPKRLRQARACYVCKSYYQELHFFYDSMCATCGDFNYAKRFQTADLTGRTALITGARVKIGFHVSLLCLRAGARVIATTRFPKDSAERYSREKDFEEWKDRLHIYGLDLRHAPSVEIFAHYVDRTYESLDLLINNAAQTVRRPPGFYRHLMDGENRDLSECHPKLQPLLRPFEDCKTELQERLGTGKESPLPVISGEAFQRAAVGIQNSAALSQIPYSYDDDTVAGLEVFPEGKTDADLQQVDRREMNSWRLGLADVPTPEMLEVHLVNAVAPFVLCSKLKGALLRSPFPIRHIVNVSAMEGKFTRFTKTDKHPHTNMAKAALNMLTLTSAKDYLKDQIYMNAVDTGWVTDEDPETFATRKKDELNFQPPLDIVDGAARICDPFFHGFLTGSHESGKFLKDYRTTEW